MLVVKQLQKKFGLIHAVRDVSFHVARGEVLGFLGPNGAGKTTTMRMVTGFLPPTAGTAVIMGHDIIRDPVAAKKRLGYLPENAPVYTDMTVENYLEFIASIRGFVGHALTERIQETIAICRLDTAKKQVIGTLSKGYKQRVCFAQALLHDPPVLVMDEPTDGLDPNQKHIVRSMIREMAARKAIVISTHILEEVEAICSRVIIIRNGTIVANASPEELKSKSRTHGAVELVVPSVPADLKSKLEKLNSVARIVVLPPNAETKTTRDQMPRVLIYPQPPTHSPARLTPDILALIKTNPEWDIAAIKTLEGRLDDVFRELTVTTESVRHTD